MVGRSPTGRPLATLALAALCLLGTTRIGLGQDSAEPKRLPRLLVVPFAFLGEEQASDWDRALLPEFEPLAAEVRLKLTAAQRLEWVDLDSLDPGEVESALGGGPGAGLLPPQVLSALGRASSASWILVGEVGRHASVSDAGEMSARLELRVALYDMQRTALIHDAKLAFEQSEPGLEPTAGAYVPTELLQRLLRSVRDEVAQQVLEAAFPPRISKVRSDKTIEVDGGREVGLYPYQELEFFRGPSEPEPLGKLRLEYVSRGSSQGRLLDGEPEPGLYLRPAELGQHEQAAAALPAEPAAPKRSNDFLLKALLATVALISVPLVITVILERRKPVRTGSERIRVTETTQRKSRRAGAQAWEAGYKERLARTEQRRRESGRPPRRQASAWEMSKAKGLQVHAAGGDSDSESSASESGEDLGIDMSAPAAEGPAGSFAYASAASRLRDLVDEAWASESSEDLIPRAVERPAPDEAPTNEPQPAEPAPAQPDPADGRSAAQRRLDELLGD